METRKLGVLALVDKKGDIVAIVHHNEKERTQVLVLCSKAGVEDYEKLFNDLINEGKSNG